MTLTKFVLLSMSATLLAVPSLACSYTTSPTSITFEPGGGAQTITITASDAACPWSIQQFGSPAAVTFSPQSGSGSATVTVTQFVQARDAAGQYLIAGQRVSITQFGTDDCVPTVSSPLVITSTGVVAPFNVGAAGGTAQLSVSMPYQGCIWSIPKLVLTGSDKTGSWLTAPSPPMTGSGTLTLMIAANPNHASRSLQFAVCGQYSSTCDALIGPALFNLNQAGLSCTYALAGPTGVIAAKGSASVAINVTAAAPDCTWSLQSDSAWLTLSSPVAPYVSQTINATAADNPAYTNRTATVNVVDATDGTKVQTSATASVTQAGLTATITLNPTAVTADPAGSTGTISVTSSAANYAWTATSDSSWLTITAGATGTGNGSVNYTVAVNNTRYLRFGTATVAGQNVAFVQDTNIPIDPSLHITAAVPLYDNSSTFTVDPGSTTPQTRAVTLTSGLGSVTYNSTVSGSPLLLTFTGGSGTTPATITFTADPSGLVAGTYRNLATFATGSGATVSYTVALTVGTGLSKVGIYRDMAGLLLFDSNGDGTCCSGDLIGQMGQAGDVPLQGDWTGTGTKAFGLYRSSTGMFLLDVNDNGLFDAGVDKALTLAPQPGDVPVVGDWTGSGVDRAGVFRPINGTWYLDLNNDGSFSGRAYLGQIGDIALVGNWNGAGLSTKIGVYRPLSTNGQPGNFFLLDGNGDGQYTSADPPPFFLGQAGDVPITGDWSGNGKTKVGVFRPAGSSNGAGLLLLDQNGNLQWDGPGVDSVLYFGPYLSGPGTSTSVQAGDLPVTGNWAASYGASNTVNVQGRTRTGIYRPSTGTFFLDLSADGTYQGRAFLGRVGDVPVGLPLMANGVVVSVNRTGGAR